MAIIPPSLEELVGHFSAVFSRPTGRRFAVFILAVIVTLGRRTVCNVVRTAPALLSGHVCSYHRLFSRRRWSSWALARRLAELVIGRLVPKGARIHLTADDTVDEHRGRKVYGKDRHRDAQRSSRNFRAFLWGHKWVVLAVVVRLPFAKRPWALPVLVALFRSPKWHAIHGGRHRTPPELLAGLLAVLLRWFPERRFTVSGDGNFATHQLAMLAARSRNRLTVVSRFYSDAFLFEPPPPASAHRGRGRKPLKGAKADSPAEVVAKSPRQCITTRWYGATRRRVEIVSAVGHWYRAGKGLVAVRWVFVHCPGSERKDEYFFTTDLRLSPKSIIEIYTERWSIEVTYEDARAYLGLGTTRCRSERAVLREAPLLFGLYSFVVLAYTQMVPAGRAEGPKICWPGKTSLAFSDVVTVLRRRLWLEWIIPNCAGPRAFAIIKPDLRELLLAALAPAG